LIITSEEAAKLLSISKRTLQRWINEEGLPYIQLKERGKLLFNEEELLAWLDKYQEPMPVHLKLQKIKLIRR